MGKFLIYYLEDPVNPKKGYVGKSCSGLNRPRAHFEPKSLLRGNTYKNRWLKPLLEKGIKPAIKILQTQSSAEDLSSLEIYWIAKLKEDGYELTNGTDGGDGMGRRPGFRHSEETKRKMSNTRIGRCHYRFTEDHKIVSSRKRGITDFKCRENNKMYLTLAEAEKDLGVGRQNISRILKGKQKQIRGYSFEFLNGTTPQWKTADKDETAILLSRSLGGYSVFCPQTNITYATANEAARCLGINSGRVSEVLHKKRNHFSGYTFKYEEAHG